MNARLRVMQTPMQTPIVCKLIVVAAATQPFDRDDRQWPSWLQSARGVRTEPDQRGTYHGSRCRYRQGLASHFVLKHMSKKVSSTEISRWWILIGVAIQRPIIRLGGAAV
jgi:hypothetical protein